MPLLGGVAPAGACSPAACNSVATECHTTATVFCACAGAFRAASRVKALGPEGIGSPCSCWQISLLVAGLGCLKTALTVTGCCVTEGTEVRARARELLCTPLSAATRLPVSD